MGTYLNIVQIILAVALTAVILMQTSKGGVGSVFGGVDSSVQHTRRGVERTLFIVTIVLAVLFFLIALINALVTGAGG